MKDLIERQAAIDKVEMLVKKYFDHPVILRSVRDMIEQLPSAQPERKMGKWIVGPEFEDCRYAKCNQCKVTQVFYYNKPLTNFCPNCGADMRGEQND